MPSTVCVCVCVQVHISLTCIFLLNHFSVSITHAYTHMQYIVCKGVCVCMCVRDMLYNLKTDSEKSQHIFAIH